MKVIEKAPLVGAFFMSENFNFCRIFRLTAG